MKRQTVPLAARLRLDPLTWSWPERCIRRETDPRRWRNVKPLETDKERRLFEDLTRGLPCATADDFGMGNDLEKSRGDGYADARRKSIEERLRAQPGAPARVVEELEAAKFAYLFELWVHLATKRAITEEWPAAWKDVGRARDVLVDVLGGKMPELFPRAITLKMLELLTLLDPRALDDPHVKGHAARVGFVDDHDNLRMQALDKRVHSFSNRRGRLPGSASEWRPEAVKRLARLGVGRRAARELFRAIGIPDGRKNPQK